MSAEWFIRQVKKKEGFMKPSFSEELQKRIVIFDGAMGTEIYKRHVFVNVCFDELCFSRPALIKEIHQSYLEAGADVITTNSFGANRIKLRQFGMGDKTHDINQAAAYIAREVADNAEDRYVFVAGSVGPVQRKGLSEVQVIETLREQIQGLIDGGIDFVLFETHTSRWELQMAVSAMESFPEIEYMLSATVDENNLSPHNEAMPALFAPFKEQTKLSKQVAWGLNCSVGPEGLLSGTEEATKLTSLPLIIQPNAGMPKSVGDRMLYMSSPEYFTTYARRYIDLGVRGVGGCCGTTPEHVREMSAAIKPLASKKHIFREVEQVEEVQPVEPTPLGKRSEMGRKLAEGEWLTSVEITPPRGFDISSVIEKSIVCRLAGVDTINIPDGPRASARMSPMVTAIKIQQEAGIEPVLHFCSRDRNLIGMQSDMLGCAAAGINNVLFITGDPPKLGDYPHATAVFDADSIGMVQVQDRMNRGIDLGGQKLSQPTSCVIGVGADPNALDMEREIARFREKVEAGANVVTTQPVFDVEALLRFIEASQDFYIPFVAGIWPLASFRNASFMKNEVPGVHVPDWIMARMGKWEQREDQLKEGISIARESLEQIRDAVQGVQVSAPFGNVNTAISVLA